VKEIEVHQPEKTELHAVKPVKRDGWAKKTLTPKPGQKCYELNLKTMIISEATFDVERVEFVAAVNLFTGLPTNATTRVVRDVIRNDDCLYCVAINHQNADKHFHKMLGKTYKKKKSA
jgi:hypothetical protein